jgi:hypothetical protein
MEAGLRDRKTRWVAPAVLFLIFFNTFLLPQGLSFTVLLTPVWIFLLHKENRLSHLKPLLIAVVLYTTIHLYLGAELLYYTISTTLLFCIATFCIWLRPYLADGFLDYQYLMRRTVQVNFLFTLLSLPFLFILPLKPLVWYTMSMSDSIRVLPRLKLFTYEASHYGYLIAPLFIFYCSKTLFEAGTKSPAAMFMTTIPLLLSLSFGVFACLIISGCIISCIFFSTIFDTSRKRQTLLLSITAFVLLGLLLYVFFPQNILYVRLHNFFTGRDTSGRGRTYESFILAHKIIAEKSFLWGIGPGQIKELGRSIIIQYYHYSRIPDTIRIPNACAETIACFGYMGFALRLSIQAWLFFATRVYSSPSRLWLFLFLFIFQFSGSYLTNTTEYVFWLLACSPAFDIMPVPIRREQMDSSPQFTLSAAD